MSLVVGDRSVICAGKSQAPVSQNECPLVDELHFLVDVGRKAAGSDEHSLGDVDVRIRVGFSYYQEHFH